jgi:hypothetical protein
MREILLYTLQAAVVLWTLSSVYRHRAPFLRTITAGLVLFGIADVMYFVLVYQLGHGTNSIAVFFLTSLPYGFSFLLFSKVLFDLLSSKDSLRVPSKMEG